MFIGNEKLIDKIQPEIIKFFEQSRTIDILSVMLVKEWGSLEKWDIENIEGMIGRETIKQWITEKTAEMLPVASILNKPVRELTANFSDIIVDKGVPIFVEKGAEYVNNHFQPLFQNCIWTISWKNRFQPFRCPDLRKWSFPSLRRNCR
ncbi:MULTISPECIES: hypothetical protein [unclassified Bacillus (in: firmicutes)]|uniref:hypothetical protein n=1 Tax=unclassified Bacillus (in: firmicutes) TaxID=185979 RepID=UPI001BED102D|nr:MULTISPECIES: hypothetical protein [unclassified Bacillus (in: firmicutes)]MBT2614638.1 hypothetical protein [Bacillus sp. ISL-78]MBT2632064.1 hypothetical protein [Bacillus sp. ISL-101]MBT2715618.1 hypothetical protein [Bacillus sp. ISL-57]